MDQFDYFIQVLVDYVDYFVFVLGDVDDFVGGGDLFVFCCWVGWYQVYDFDVVVVVLQYCVDVFQ